LRGKKKQKRWAAAQPLSIERPEGQVEKGREARVNKRIMRAHSTDTIRKEGTKKRKCNEVEDVTKRDSHVKGEWSQK